MLLKKQSLNKEKPENKASMGRNTYERKWNKILALKN